MPAASGSLLPAIAVSVTTAMLAAAASTLHAQRFGKRVLRPRPAKPATHARTANPFSITRSSVTPAATKAAREGDGDGAEEPAVQLENPAGDQGGDDAQERGRGALIRPPLRQRRLRREQRPRDEQSRREQERRGLRPCGQGLAHRKVDAGG